MKNLGKLVMARHYSIRDRCFPLGMIVGISDNQECYDIEWYVNGIASLAQGYSWEEMNELRSLFGQYRKDMLR